MSAPQKWRPSLWLVLGGALVTTLALSLAGMIALRYLGPEIGFRNSAYLLTVMIGILTAILWLLLSRLLLRPITALSAYAAALRTPTAASPEPPKHFGTQELRHMAESVLDMANTLQNREATIRSFTNHVTHELKTPVTAIQAATELLQSSDTLTADDAKLVTQIRQANAQMNRQLAALHTVARAREANYEGQSMLAQLADPLAEKHPTLDLKIKGGGIPLPISAEGLTLILDHLAANAAAHSATQLRLTATQTALGTTLDISNNGDTISKGNAAKIFDPFFTTRRSTGGTGMGLTIAASVLRTLGATLTLQDSKTGANFRVHFP